MSFRQFARIQALKSPRLVIVRDHSATPLAATVAAAALATAAVLFAASSAHGSALSWNNALGGQASTAGNWSPAQIPVAADDLTFALAGTYAITFNSTVPTSHTQAYRAGTISLTTSSPHTVTNGLTVGLLSGDNPIVTLTTGTLTSTLSATIGNASGSNGRINVNDNDADLIIGSGADLTVGSGGNGILSITGTGHVQVDDQFILGANSTSTSSATVSGFSITPFGASLLETLSTGQSRIGAGGDATLTVDTGGLAHFAGDLVIANGSASTSSVTVQTAGLLNARLLVDGDLLIGRNVSAATAAGIGTLNVNTGGTADIGGDTFIGDPDGSTGLLQIGGGTFNGTGAINVLAGHTINGFGTINADINNSGNIQPSGTGLNIGGTLFNTTSNLIVGSKINFAGTGGYEGSGTCQADISGDTTSHITATGTLTIGANTTSGFFYLGNLDVGGNIVTLVDSNQAVLGGLTTFNSGRIQCSTGVGIQNGGALRGDGLIVGSVVNSGIIDPSFPSNPNAGGLITVQGNLTMNPTGEFHLDINNDPEVANANGRMNVSGTATFGGTLHLRLRDGYFPNQGDQFIAINATGGRIGTFDSLVVDSAPRCNGVRFVLVYSSTAAIVLTMRPDADVNEDKVVNIDDLVWVITRWGDPGQGPNGVSPIDIDDLVLVVTRWGCQSN